MNFSDWVDPAKKGLIVVGLMRSGSHLLADVIFKSLQSTMSNVVQLGEIGEPIPFPQIFTPTHHAVTFPRLIQYIDRTEAFTVSSVVLAPIKTMMFGFEPNQRIIADRFVTVKLGRRNVAEQLMSIKIKNCLSKMGNTTFHSGLTQNDYAMLNEIDPMYRVLDLKLLIEYYTEMVLLSQWKMDHSIQYEDIVHMQSSFVKNRYPWSPEEFFTNYAECKELLTALEDLNDW